MAALPAPDEFAISNRIERGLLAVSAVFLAVNFAALALLGVGQQPAPWLHLLVWGFCAIGGNRVLNRYLPERDPLLFPLVMFLSGWGLIIIDRLAPAFADRQTVWLVVATVALVATASLPQIIRNLRAYRYTLLVVGLVLLISTILLGRNPSGFGPELWLGIDLENWFGIGSIFFQPSEALKIILVAFLASYLSEQYPALRPPDGHSKVFAERHPWLSPRILGPILLMWGICMVVLAWQRDLGTAAIFFVVFLILLYVASGQALILFSGAALLAAAMIAAYFLVDLVQLRIDIWINPWIDPDGDAFQVVQSLMAFGAGGVFGQGVGQGSPDFIPVVHSDFVFAAIAEEWGLIGVVVIIAVIAIVVMRGLRIAVQTQERPFYALMAVGLSMLLAVQSLLIMGGVLKIVPLTGVTLPYLSYGGSSLLMSFVLMGLLLRLSAEARQ
jgi:cell division protein FtsW (lipid II flippase)